MYVLQGITKDAKPNGIRGVYDTKGTLYSGIEHWIKLRPEESLFYEIWQCNYAPEASEFDWVYIALGSQRLAEENAENYFPVEKHWGKILLT